MNAFEVKWANRPQVLHTTCEGCHTLQGRRRAFAKRRWMDLHSWRTVKPARQCALCNSSCWKMDSNFAFTYVLNDCRAWLRPAATCSHAYMSWKWPKSAGWTQILKRRKTGINAISKTPKFAQQKVPRIFKKPALKSSEVEMRGKVYQWLMAI